MWLAIFTGKPPGRTKAPPAAAAAEKFPPPGGGWPRRGRETAPAGACGEQPPKAALSERRNAGGNPAMTEIFRPPAGSDLRGGLGNGTDFQISARIPLQSPVGSEEPTGDSFPPGEAKGAPAPVLLS